MMLHLIRTAASALFLITGIAVAAEPASPAGEQSPTQENAPKASSAQTAEPAVNTSAATAKPTTKGAAQNAAQGAAARRPGNDRLELDTTIVTGNRELPKVLYIVPWKKADIGELPAQPFNTLLDEVLTPVDRDVFRREVTYYGVVSAGSNVAGATPASPPAASPPAGSSEK